MGLHRLSSVVLGVPDVAANAAFYRDFGLRQLDDSSFSSSVGGRQLILAHSPVRRLLELTVAADSEDDIARCAAALDALGIPAQVTNDGLSAVEPLTGIRTVVRAEPPLRDDGEGVPVGYNSGGHVARANRRAEAVLRRNEVLPRKLGHVVVGTRDVAAVQRFFEQGIGFKVSDAVPGLAVFLRCSQDHHNLLIQIAPTEFFHHSSWEVADIDEIGRGAIKMLSQHPERHVWGLGRHNIGSNFFWYLRDPARNFAEYYSDLDVIVDDQLWDPNVFTAHRGLALWGPPPPPSFLHPDDLAELMAGSHSALRHG